MNAVCHVRVAAGDPWSRGHRLGVATAALIESTWQSYKRAFRVIGRISPDDAMNMGEELLQHLSVVDPEVASELVGIATGSGVDARQIALLNARTELLFQSECSVAARGQPAPWLVQTWDWFLDARERCLVVSREGSPGQLAHVTFTEPGILGKCGVNEAGIALGIALLQHESDEFDASAVPVHVLLWSILARCSRIDEVVDLCRFVKTCASVSVIAVASDGDVVCLEVGGGRALVVDPDPTGFVAHTNCFVRPEHRRHEAGAITADECSRLAALSESRPRTPEAAFSVLRRHDIRPVPLCRHGDSVSAFLPKVGTVALLQMDPVTRTLRVGVGPACETGTMESMRVPTFEEA